MDISNLIPNTEKGQPLGVATLDITGKVPSAQLPAKPGNFLPIAGGTMTGTLNMGSKDIVSAQSIDSGLILSNNLRGRTNTTNPILIENPINMNAKKITNAAKGTANGDVVTVENINDHDTSPFAHANIRNLISAIQGAYIYRGVINENTINVTQINLNARILVLMGRAAILGDVLTDLDRTDWYFDGASWDNMGQTFVVLASAVNDGLMSKEDYTKLFDLYTKAQLDAKFELLANKAVDWSVLNDTKYPTTKAVAEMLLNLPIAELNNHTLREVFEGGNLVVNGDFSKGTTGWNITTGYTNDNSQLKLVADGSISTNRQSSQKISLPTGDKVYVSYKYKLTNYIQGQLNTQIADYNDSVALSNNFVTTVTDYTYGSKLVTSTNNGIQINLRGESSPNFTAYWDDIRVINTTALGISALTVAQMDYWFNVYQALQVSMANGIFTMLDTKADKTLETWIAPTLVNSWAGSTARYYRNNFGEIRLSGSITTGTIGTTAFTLPTGYRPSQIVRCPVESNGAFGYVVINTDGTVVPTIGSNTRFSLDGVYFRGA